MEFLLQEPYNLFLRIIMAAFLGGVLGVERDIHGRQAGLRTHILVSAGAALFFILSTHIATLNVVVPDGFVKVADAGRIAAQIVSGIGFLGAGVILKEGFTVVGLTTAACLWISAAIGMASGAGMYFIACGTTGLALFALVLLRRLERFYRKDAYRKLEVEFPVHIDVLRIVEIVKDNYVTITSLDFQKNYDTLLTNAKLSLRFFYRGDVGMLSHKIISKLENSRIAFRSIKWINR